jgi:hypothetical protein
MAMPDAGLNNTAKVIAHLKCHPGAYLRSKSPQNLKFLSCILKSCVCKYSVHIFCDHMIFVS